MERLVDEWDAQDQCAKQMFSSEVPHDDQPRNSVPLREEPPLDLVPLLPIVLGKT